MNYIIELVVQLQLGLFIFGMLKWLQISVQLIGMFSSSLLIFSIMFGWVCFRLLVQQCSMWYSVVVGKFRVMFLRYSRFGLISFGCIFIKLRIGFDNYYSIVFDSGLISSVSYSVWCISGLVLGWLLVLWCWVILVVVVSRVLVISRNIGIQIELFSVIVVRLCGLVCLVIIVLMKFMVVVVSCVIMIGVVRVSSFLSLVWMCKLWERGRVGLFMVVFVWVGELCSLWVDGVVRKGQQGCVGYLVLQGE